MVFKKIVWAMALTLLFGVFCVSATQQQLDIKLNEYVDQQVKYNPLKVGSGTWYNLNENQSFYNLTGFIIVKNVNLEGKDLNDIYVAFQNTKNMSLPSLYQGRTGKFIANNTNSNVLVLHIPQLRAGQNSTWRYAINKTRTIAPLNMTSKYSDTKVLAGSNITITDRLSNAFNNFAFQTSTCIYDINVTQITTPVMFGAAPQHYYFVPSSVGGKDASNVTITTPANRSMYWNVLKKTCLNKGQSINITYKVKTPYNVPKTTHYSMINATLKYKLNQTISHLMITSIRVISEANLSFDKKIIGPSHPTLYGSNVTWNVTALFMTGTNISYKLNSATLWVAKRTGISGDPNYVANDTISNAGLKKIYSPFVIVNKTAPWKSLTWKFNYSDVPTPIVWMDVNFTIANDGKQLINRSLTQNGKDLYIKELYLIVGYWLEIDKNITAIGTDKYNVKIRVRNKGNQVTPAGTVVTIYDFKPANYNRTSNFKYLSSAWYSTSQANNTVIGKYNGTLYRWGLVPTNSLNTSFAAGPAINSNTSWSVTYNVTGLGDYKVMDVFITGLDPQLIEGAGASNGVVVSEIIERMKSTEGVFAIVASVLLLLGLLL
jgi:hypothetical protein